MMRRSYNGKTPYSLQLKHLMVLDVCTGKEGKAGLCYENTLIENTFLDPTTRNFLNT